MAPGPSMKSEGGNSHPWDPLPAYSVSQASRAEAPGQLEGPPPHPLLPAGPVLGLPQGQLSLPRDCTHPFPHLLAIAPLWVPARKPGGRRRSGRNRRKNGRRSGRDRRKSGRNRRRSDRSGKKSKRKSSRSRRRSGRNRRRSNRNRRRKGRSKRRRAKAGSFHCVERQMGPQHPRMVGTGPQQLKPGRTLTSDLCLGLDCMAPLFSPQPREGLAWGASLAPQQVSLFMRKVA